MAVITARLFAVFMVSPVTVKFFFLKSLFTGYRNYSTQNSKIENLVTEISLARAILLTVFRDVIQLSRHIWQFCKVRYKIIQIDNTYDFYIVSEFYFLYGGALSLPPFLPIQRNCYAFGNGTGLLDDIN